MEFAASRPVRNQQLEARKPERTADVLVDLLVEAGVEVVYGLPGGAISPLYDALLDRPAIRVVTTRHEGAAMFAAAGYARATGKLGVVLATSGPGVLNCFTGLASAQADGLPLLLLAGEVPRRNQARGALQDGSAHNFAVVEMASHLCKHAIEITEAASAPAQLRRAIATALAGRRGPVTVTLPVDVSTAIAPRGEVAYDVSTHYSIPSWALDEAAALVAGSRRTVLFAGSGVRSGDGPARLRELAQWLQCPVITTPKGKGVFPEDHPLAAGVYGLGGHPSASALLDEGVDVLIALGTSLGELSTNGWSQQLVPRQALIHVDIDPRPFGRSYPTKLCINAPAELFCQKLMKALPRAQLRPRYEVRHYSDPSKGSVATAGRIAPQRALWELQQVVPADTLFTCDSGEHFMYAVHYLRVRHPDGFIVMSGLGSMGSGIGGALGARLAHPTRPVVAICGDGGFAMCAAEVATAVQERLPIVFFVMNDERLGMVERGHAAVYGRSPDFGTGPLGIPAMAAALGAESRVVDAAGQILDGGPLVRDLGAPLVVDVRIDPAVRMPRNTRDDALAFASRKVGK